MNTRRMTLVAALGAVITAWTVHRLLANRRPNPSDPIFGVRATLASDIGPAEGSRVDEPITASLEPYNWDSEAAVAYEAAVEAINGVVGAYSALIAQEEKKPIELRLEGEMDALRRLQAECQRVRQGIDPENAAQVRAIRTEYADRLRELRELIAR